MFVDWLSEIFIPRFGSEPPSVKDDVDIWRYAILELHARNDDDDHARLAGSGIMFATCPPVRPSVCQSICLSPNLWTWTSLKRNQNNFDANWHKWFLGQKVWNDQVWRSRGQRSRLQEAGKASVLTPLGRVASIAYRRFHPNAKQHKNLLFNCFYSHLFHLLSNCKAKLFCKRCRRSTVTMMMTMMMMLTCYHPCSDIVMRWYVFSSVSLCVCLFVSLLTLELFKILAWNFYGSKICSKARTSSKAAVNCGALAAV